MALLAVISIGQSPRDDLTGELAAYLPSGTALVERGALDGLSAPDIAGLRPEDAADTLTSRLRDGRSVVLGMPQLVPLLERAISAAEQEGAEVSLLVCTGSFPPLRHRRPLLDAERLLTRGVSALLQGCGTFGVVVPLAAQQETFAARWRSVLNMPVIAEAADPYSGSAHETIPAAAARLAARGAEMMLLDCMGFTEAARQAAADRAQKPVLLARSVVGLAAGELLRAVPGR